MEMLRQYFGNEKEYENECVRIIHEYPNQIKRVFSHPMCEYDYTFLGFRDVYASIPVLPEDFTIIDFGCADRTGPDLQKTVNRSC